LTHDPTEKMRREMLTNGLLPVSAAIADALGETWDTAALQRDFSVLAFAAPFVLVRRKSDGIEGSLKFTHSPRVYFEWKAD
jgi:hypothetical protein